MKVDIDKVPIIGTINRTMNMLILNFVLLAIVTGTLGVSIIFLPQIVEILMSSILIFSAIIFLHIAYNIHSYKAKYTKWFKD